MIIFFGKRFYGKVDQIPGLGHVATEFAHVQFFPFLPSASYWVDEDGSLIRLPMSLRSVLMAWFRGGLVMVALIAAVVAVGAGIDIHEADPWASPALLVKALASIAGCGVAYAVSLRLGKASPERARKILADLQTAE